MNPVGYSLKEQTFVQEMDADALRDAITKEMMDYQRPKLQPCQTSYILRPVTATNNCSNSLSADGDSEKYLQPVTSSAVSYSSANQSDASTSIDVVSDVSVATDGRLKPPPDVPLGIFTTVNVEIDGSLVGMPSAPAEPRTDDVTMLSARLTSDASITLQAEICQDIVGKNSGRTDTAIVRDTQSNSAVVTEANCTRSSSDTITSNSLVINTEVPQADDAKARIKAALLNSGRRRLRLGK